RRLLSQSAMITSCFSPDGRLLASVSAGSLLAEASVRIWDGTPGAEMLSLDAALGAINYMDADANGGLLVASHANGRVVVWNAREGREVPGRIQHSGIIDTVVVNRD